MIDALLPIGLLLPLANHAPDGLGLALLLYFGPVVALVGFLVFLRRRGGGGDVLEQPADDEPAAENRAPDSEETSVADDPSSTPSRR